MGNVSAAFLITVDVDDDDYAGFVSPATNDWSHEQVRSWLYQNYFDRIEAAMDLQDRPATLTWTVDTLHDVEAAREFEYQQWSLADAIEAQEIFREFARRQGDCE